MRSLATTDPADPAPARRGLPASVRPRMEGAEGEDAVLGLLLALAAFLYVTVWLIEGPPVLG